MNIEEVKAEIKKIEAKMEDAEKEIKKYGDKVEKYENELEKTIDPSAGSYYIENLTNQLSVAAWKLFQQVESLGGIIAAFEKGFITDEINQSYEAKVKNLQDGKVMVGVNKFRVEPENAKVLENSAENGVYLQNRRLSEVFE